MGRRLVAAAAALALGVAAPAAVADEGGVSFWLPGQFGSLAAVPADPGWTLPMVYYHTSVDAGGDKAFAIGGRLHAGMEAHGDLVFLFPTSILETPVLGARASVSLGGAFGNMDVAADATLTGPRGNVFSANPEDSVFSGSDLYPMASLRWNDGNHNYLAYTMGGVPVGDYETSRLANIGTKIPDTDYQNGVDFHFDWGASQFLSPQVHVGLVGYVYQQVSGDSGSRATLGDFKSRVVGIGPQVGYFFQLWERKWYVNVKGYYEFAGENRPDGWNVWLSLVVPLSRLRS